MKLGIVYDKPNRLRVRFGPYAFEKNCEKSIKALIESNVNVVKADVNYENGGILILYKGERANIIKLLKSLDFNKIKPYKSNEISVDDIDKDFKNKIARLVIKRVLQKAIMPSPIYTAYTIVRGIGFIKRGFSHLGRGKLTVEVLDGASIGACFGQRNFKTAGTIMFMLSISSLLEDYTRARTKAVLTDSLAVKTDKVWVIRDNTQILVPMKEVKIGENIVVRTGSIIPVDGEIVDGEGCINESSMTGEPLAVAKGKGATVFAGTVLEEGSVVVRVRALSGNTKIQKIIELIDNSENLKAGVQSRAERLADSIVPFSFLGFGLTLLLTRNITKAVSILMVDYSCAIKLSTPISVISALREAADCNITVKGGKYLEEFAMADSIVFDKTGTLTNAEPVLERVIAFGGYSEEEVLKTAACLEEHFPHSVARAIVRGAEIKGIVHIEEHAEVEYIVAHGIATTLHGERAVIGSKHFVTEDEGIFISKEIENEIDEKAGACSVVYLAVGNKLAGVLCISDPPREEAKEAIDLIKKSGIKNIVMLTGDSQKAAVITAERLGINECHWQVLPEFKHKYIEDLKSKGHKVIMIGDGINDAPALAVANVSVAMSDASDIARETADITLRGADLTELARLRELSCLLMKRINDNYRFIVAFNSVLLLGGFFGIISPTTSAFLHNASTMGVCAKSMGSLLNNSK